MTESQLPTGPAQRVPSGVPLKSESIDSERCAEAVLTGQATPLSPRKRGKKAKRRSLLRRRTRS